MNQDKIKQSFQQQANRFSDNHVLNNDEPLRTIVHLGDINENDWVLDFGCGTGLVTRYVEEQTKKVIGIDITKKMLKEADRISKEQGKDIIYLEGDGHVLPFLDNQFDCVVTRLTLHHLPDPKPVLQEMVRVLKPEGRLVIADIIGSNDPDKLKNHNAVEEKRDPSHVAFLTEAEIISVLHSVGLDVKETTKWKTERRLTEWLGITSMDEECEKFSQWLREDMLNDNMGIEAFEDEQGYGFIHTWMALSAKISPSS